jgi:hypothetical protein
MGIIENFKKEQAEKKAYNQIVAKRTLQASRQAYEVEAVKQARLAAPRKAVANYNKPKSAGVWGAFSTVAKGAGRMVGTTATKAMAPKFRTSTKYVKVGKKYKKVTSRRAIRQSQPMNQGLGFNDMFGGGSSSSSSSNKELTSKDIFGF